MSTLDFIQFVIYIGTAVVTKRIVVLNAKDYIKSRKSLDLKSKR